MKGTGELTVPKGLERFRNKIEERRDGLEGELKRTVVQEGPLAELRATALAGFGCYSICFLALLAGSSHISSRIMGAMAFVDTDPLKYLLEALPILVILLVVLITGLMVRSTSKEILNESATTKSLMSEIQKKFSFLASAEDVLASITKEIGEQKKILDESVKKARQQHDELRSLGYQVGTSEIPAGTIQITKKFLSTHGRLFRDAEAVSFARRWSEVMSGSDIPIDTIVLVCKKLLLNTGIGTDRQLAENLAKFTTTPIPKSDASRQAVDFGTLFKKVEVAMAKYHESQQGMDELYKGAISVAVRERTELAARANSLESKNGVIRELLEFIEASGPMSVKDTLDFFRSKVAEDFPSAELEKRIKDTCSMQVSSRRKEAWRRKD